jgi:hypothetical protein
MSGHFFMSASRLRFPSTIEGRNSISRLQSDRQYGFNGTEDNSIANVM